MTSTSQLLVLRGRHWCKRLNGQKWKVFNNCCYGFDGLFLKNPTSNISGSNGKIGDRSKQKFSQLQSNRKISWKFILTGRNGSKELDFGSKIKGFYALDIPWFQKTILISNKKEKIFPWLGFRLTSLSVQVLPAQALSPSTKSSNNVSKLNNTIMILSFRSWTCARQQIVSVKHRNQLQLLLVTSSRTSKL